MVPGIFIVFVGPSFPGTIFSVLKKEGVVEGGTGELSKNKNILINDEIEAQVAITEVDDNK